jgi:drug/metabolite transporter (DMT)-like permease
MTGVEPVLNPIWVALFYGEPITLLFAIGGGIVLASVIVYQLWLSKHQTLAEASP